MFIVQGVSNNYDTRSSECNDDGDDDDDDDDDDDEQDTQASSISPLVQYAKENPLEII